MNSPTSQTWTTPPTTPPGPVRAGEHLDPVTGHTIPALLPFAPLNTHYELARRLVTSPVLAAADRRLDEDLALAIAFAVDQPRQVRLTLEVVERLTADAGTRVVDALGPLHGGDYSGLRHVTFPNVAVRSANVSSADNPRDIVDDDTAGTGDSLGRRPLLLAEDAGDHLFAVAQEVPGPSPRAHLLARHREEIDRVMPTVAARSIRDMVTSGQRVPVDLVPSVFRDSQGTVISRQLKLREGHGRTSLAQHALEQVLTRSGIDPADITQIAHLDHDVQWRAHQAVHTTLGNARAALLSSPDPVVEFTAPRGRTVRMPRTEVIAALHGYTIRADVTVAAFEIRPGAGLVHSLQRRYESRHAEQAPLLRGADLAGAANHVLDDLAEAGVLDALRAVLDDLEDAYGATAEGGAALGKTAAQCTSTDVARWIAAPQARPSWVPLWWLPLATQWIFTRQNGAAKEVWKRHGMESLSATKEHPSKRADIAAHLVRRSLPIVADTYDTAAVQSVLTAMTGTWMPTARSTADLVDAVTVDGPDYKAALIELRGRTLVALIAPGVLHGAAGSQATTRERGQATKFVNAMLVNHSAYKRAHGRRTAEAAIETYWSTKGRMLPPRVAEATPTRGRRWEDTGEALTDLYLRVTFGKGSKKATTSDSGATMEDLQGVMDEELAGMEAILAAMAARRDSAGEPVDGSWKSEATTKFGILIAALSSL